MKVEKEYVFDTPEGKRWLADLFDGRSQLIVQHFMFGPGWKEGCVSGALSNPIIWTEHSYRAPKNGAQPVEIGMAEVVSGLLHAGGDEVLIPEDRPGMRTR